MIYEDLKGKKVLITGSSSGIGQATAIMFAKQGCFVGVHYFQTKDGGEKTLSEVKKYSDGILLKADIRSEKQVNKMIERFANAPSLAFARKRGGRIDVLVNNAGSLIARHPFETAPLDYHEDTFATNARSVFLAAKAALPHLKKSKGCIVNIGTIASFNGGAGGSGIYAAAKAAVLTETIAMAVEFAKYKIRVNCVVPGLIETRFHQRFSTPERRNAVALQTPLGRNGSADDIAKAILFLSSSEAASFITGAFLHVNGGLLMRL
jgi:3-oxoacyl-[acyl-carrier protein] reductase